MGLSLKFISRGLNAVNPVRIGEGIMANVIKNVVISVIKGLAATFVVALAAMEHVAPAATDPYTVAIWGLFITGVHALGTFIQHQFVTPAAK